MDSIIGSYGAARCVALGDGGGGAQAQSGPPAGALDSLEARELYRLGVQPGARIYTVLRHASRSGMQRVISLHVATPGGDLVGISHTVASLLGLRWDGDRGGVVVRGAGMDMGFYLVCRLGRTLYPDGVGEGARGANAAAERDGGYALVQVWA